MKVTNHFFTVDTEAADLVTLAQAKAQLRVESDFEEEDDLIQSYIDAAIAAAENYIGAPLVKGVKTFELDALTQTFVFKQAGENDTVKAVSYWETDATEVTEMPTNNYKLRKNYSTGCKEIKFETYPTTATRDDAVIIEINQGYTAATLPTPIYQAIMLMITSMYVKREDIGEIGNNSQSRALMRPYRNY